MVEVLKPCCAPPRGGTNDEKLVVPKRGEFERAKKALRLKAVSGFTGTNAPLIKADGEGPKRKTRLKAFRLDPCAVSVEDFSNFIEATGYKTEAERFGWSFVFYDQAEGRGEAAARVSGADWWCQVFGANWRHPFGPKIEAPPNHPVTHVSHQDAMAYAAWVGGRLPSEAEWEHAARGGLSDPIFPWGDEEPVENPTNPQDARCNIWQGKFPDLDLAYDGYHGTAPIDAYAPNGLGFYNMVGNVWEWCADRFKVRSLSKWAGPINAQAKGRRVLKGGSYLCHKSYCFRYRIAARIGNTPDSTTTHQGFRVAYDEKIAQ